MGGCPSTTAPATGTGPPSPTGRTTSTSTRLCAATLMAPTTTVMGQRPMINADILPNYIYTGLSTKYLIQVVFKFTQFMNLRFHKCTHTSYSWIKVTFRV